MLTPHQMASNAHSGGGQPGRSNLGDILVEVGVISREQLMQAMSAAGGNERDLGKWLVDLGFTTEEKIMKGIGIKAKVPYFTSLEGLYTFESASIISEELARRLQVVPLFKIENVATVAMVNPLDVFTIDALVKTTNLRIDPVVCMRTTIFDTINKLYGGYEGGANTLTAGQAPSAFMPEARIAPPSGSDNGLIIEFSPSGTTSETPTPQNPSRPAPYTNNPSPSYGPGPETTLPAITTRMPDISGRKSMEPRQGTNIKPLEDADFNKLATDLKSKLPDQQRAGGALDTKHGSANKDAGKKTEDAPIIQLVDAIFKQAVIKKASDIHIEPFGDHTEVRFRIDGILRPAMTVPKEYENALVARIKVVANLDITESRQPQDGRVPTEVQGRPVDLRISTLPTVHGEKVVIRILDKGQNKFVMEKLGFPPKAQEIFKDCLDRSSGIILVTGPTGSGKSTTLYTGLTFLNSPERNIVTLEDPVEYQIARLNQVQINAKVGLTFAKGLRSILRQDPDVVMVGEIRDQETGEIAIQAALTGHLVLSTLHTNDAPSAITRLINMKVEPFLISASVLLIIAQRLMRMLCPECKQAYEPPEAVVKQLVDEAGEPYSMSFFRPGGCDKCNQTGYSGRKGVYELLRMTPEIREMAVKRATADEIREVAKKQGMSPLFSEGAAHVFAGNTSIEEMMRVCRISD
jgi:type II secretory ATPase GspE/PulE/Tfp pilus assembly ATPase PilB-like protein